MDAAHRWRLAIDQEHAAGVGVLSEEIGLAPPVEMDPLGDRVAVAGKADGRLQHLRERPGAVVPKQLLPGIDCAGHGDREGRVARDLTRANRGPTGLERRTGGSSTRSVKGDDPVPAARGEQCKAVTADPGRAWLDDALDGAGSDCGIHGIAAGLKDIDRRQRGKRMRGGGHPVPRHHDRSTGFLKISHDRTRFSNGQVRQLRTD
jgi:hypothetical protein